MVGACPLARSRRTPGTVAIPQYWLNKAKQHTQAAITCPFLGVRQDHVRLHTLPANLCLLAAAPIAAACPICRCCSPCANLNKNSEVAWRNQGKNPDQSVSGQGVHRF